jgi:hypothetical protein
MPFIIKNNLKIILEFNCIKNPIERIFDVWFNSYSKGIVNHSGNYRIDNSRTIGSQSWVCVYLYQPSLQLAINQKIKSKYLKIYFIFLVKHLFLFVRLNIHRNVVLIFLFSLETSKIL